MIPKVHPEKVTQWLGEKQMDTPRNVLDAIQIHKGRCYQHIAAVLAEAVFQQEWDSLTLDTQTDLLIVAGQTVEAITERGWDLVFDQDGSYGYVIT